MPRIKPGCQPAPNKLRVGGRTCLTAATDFGVKIDEAEVTCRDRRPVRDGATSVPAARSGGRTLRDTYLATQLGAKATRIENKQGSGRSTERGEGAICQTRTGR